MSEENIRKKNENERIMNPEAAEDDYKTSYLRPQNLKEFIGQKQIRGNLRVFIDAAKGRQEAMDHVLLHGPPGLGKTTLAQIVARELEVNFRMTSGPTITKAGDLSALLTNLSPKDVLFIDEIHRLNPSIEEVLYPAMEDFQLDLMIGEGGSSIIKDRSTAIHFNCRYNSFRLDNDPAERSFWNSHAIAILCRR